MVRDIGIIVTLLVLCFGAAINNPAIVIAGCYCNFLIINGEP